MSLAYARTAPSAEPANTTPGIDVSAADCAALQPGPLPQTGGSGGAYQRRWPVARSTACTPPGAGVSWSATAKYARSPSLVAPQTPPTGLPLPQRYCQITLPRRSGFNA